MQKYQVKKEPVDLVIGRFYVVPLNQKETEGSAKFKTGNHYKTCKAVASFFITKLQAGEISSLEEIVVDDNVLEIPTPMLSPNAAVWPTFKDEFYGRLDYYLKGRK